MNFITRGAGIGLIITLPWLSSSSLHNDATAGSTVSYGHQIAPMFALHCAGCHGLSNPSSDLRVTRFASLRAGGNIGDEIVPGHPERSVLLDFIEGKRGPSQRMPQNSAPLSPGQIALVRKWIKDGAENDNAVEPCFDLRILSVPAETGKPIQIRSRIMTPALTILIVRDPKSGRELFADEGSVNRPKEAGNIAAPGEWFSRTLVGEQGWPSSVSVEVRIQYASATPSGSGLTAAGQSTSNLLRSVCPPL